MKICIFQKFKITDGRHIGNKKTLYLRHRLTDRDEILREYVEILPKGFNVCANGLIVVKITVAVGGKSGNKTAKINVKNSSIYHLV